MTKTFLAYTLNLMKRPIILFIIISLLIFIFGCATIKDASEPEPLPVEEPVIEPQPIIEEPEVVPEENTFVVTEEFYAKTFIDIEKMILELNNIILKQDYNTWLSYLTDEYIRRFSDPENLQQISEEPKLKRYNVRLRNLRDYFNYVVVGSRQNVRLDDIVFIDSDHVKALMVIDGVPYLLYLLENINGEWKIGIW